MKVLSENTILVTSQLNQNTSWGFILVYAPTTDHNDAVAYRK